MFLVICGAWRCAFSSESDMKLSKCLWTIKDFEVHDSFRCNLDVCVLKRLQRMCLFFTLVIPSHICKPLYVTVSMEEWQCFVYIISSLQIEGETHVTCCSFTHLKNNMLRCTFSSKKTHRVYGLEVLRDRTCSVSHVSLVVHTLSVLLLKIWLFQGILRQISVCVCVCVCVCVWACLCGLWGHKFV